MTSSVFPLIETIHADLLAKKYSCGDLITDCIEKAQKNEHNACTAVFAEKALEKAKAVDAKIAAGKKLKKLEGIPFGAKDTYLRKGELATGGASILTPYTAPYTATAIKKCEDAGAILIAKENCDAFGHGSSTENSCFWPTRNAHDPSLVAGGSSGGSAVNVATQTTYFSLGEDTGGSIRQPAGYNAIVWFKPSYGAISRQGCMAYASSLDTMGPLTQNVSDAITVFSHLVGKDDHDQTSIDLPAPKKKNQSLRGKKIGYYTSFFSSPALDPTIKTAIDALFEGLVAAGATLHPLDFFPDEVLVATYYIIATAETASNLSRIDGLRFGKQKKEADWIASMLASRDDGFSPETKRRIILGNQVLAEGYTDKYYNKACAIRNDICSHFARDFETVDMIISPVTPNLVPKIGDVMYDPLAMYLSDIYTVGFSLWKLPTLSLPAGTPTGIQLTGAYGSDRDVLARGKEIEKVYA